jgi:hypothetical protein
MATTAGGAARARSDVAPGRITGEYRSYLSWLEERAWAEAAEHRTPDEIALPAARDGFDWGDTGGGAAAAVAFALAGGTIVMRRRRQRTGAHRPARP